MVWRTWRGHPSAAQVGVDVQVGMEVLSAHGPSVVVVLVPISERHSKRDVEGGIGEIDGLVDEMDDVVVHDE